MRCRICANERNNQTFIVEEMMGGTREEFSYFDCSDCGCFQISEFPPDVSKYYFQGYYSSGRRETPKRRLEKMLLKVYILLNLRIAGKLVLPLFSYSALYNWLKKTRVGPDSRILELGCGRGGLLLTLRYYGFKNVLGVDPHIDAEIVNEGVKVLKSTIHELSDSQTFDLVIFNHSFEHISDQLETLAAVSRILSDSGFCVIRMPVKTEYIWNRYGVNWFQIDAPRHFFVHTLRSFELLAARAGLVVQDVTFDSTELQFCASEQYERGIPLRAENSYFVNPKSSIFTKKQIREYKKMAKQLNLRRQGDQAVFYLMKRCKK